MPTQPIPKHSHPISVAVPNVRTKESVKHFTQCKMYIVGLQINRVNVTINAIND